MSWRPYRDTDHGWLPEPEPGDPGYVDELDPEPERHTPTDPEHRIRFATRWHQWTLVICSCGWRSRLYNTQREASQAARHHRNDPEIGDP